VACSDCTFPTAWFKVGVVATLETPGSTEADFIKTHCPDYSGDGVGDNGWKSFATTFNPEIQKALGAGELALVLEFQDVTDFNDTESFELAGLYGKPETPGGGTYLIDPLSYTATAPSSAYEPRFAFTGARISGGVLSAGPATVTVTIAAAPLGVGSMVFEQVLVTASITDDGVTATDGVISGVYTKAQYDAAMAKIYEHCAAHPDEGACSYLHIATEGPGFPFDLDLDKNGKKDASSLCFRFTLKAGTIVGLKQ
jgi:hypothetical protein